MKFKQNRNIIFNNSFMYPNAQKNRGFSCNRTKNPVSSEFYSARNAANHRSISPRPADTVP